VEKPSSFAGDDVPGNGEDAVADFRPGDLPLPEDVRVPDDPGLPPDVGAETEDVRPDGPNPAETVHIDVTQYECQSAEDCEKLHWGEEIPLCHHWICQGDAQVCVVEQAPDDTPCGTGEPCAPEGVCFEGECAMMVGVPCDDGNLCTEDWCDEKGVCQFEPKGGWECDDGNPCTLDDSCSDEGFCQGGYVIGCDDGNPCTKDSCVAEGDTPESFDCETEPLQDVECEDGIECSVGDTCIDGQCVGYLDDSKCDDNDPCTKDYCGEGWAGCQHEPSPECGCQSDVNCPDNEDKCDGVPICLDGQCVPGPGTVVECQELFGALCLKNQCNPATGKCEPTPIDIGGMCDDGNPCTTKDACQEDGGCLGEPKICTDGNPCTTDSCNPAIPGGCFYKPAYGFPCDDLNLCTSDDKCNALGKCVGLEVMCEDQDADPCVSFECDLESGKCVPVVQPGCGGCAATGGMCVNPPDDVSPAMCPVNFMQADDPMECTDKNPKAICCLPPPPECIWEGGFIDPNQVNMKCCDGLTPLEPHDLALQGAGVCEATGGGLTCGDCGNLVCDFPWEGSCNCSDCTKCSGPTCGAGKYCLYGSCYPCFAEICGDKADNDCDKALDEAPCAKSVCPGIPAQYKEVALPALLANPALNDGKSIVTAGATAMGKVTCVLNTCTADLLLNDGASANIPLANGKLGPPVGCSGKSAPEMKCGPVPAGQVIIVWGQVGKGLLPIGGYALTFEGSCIAP
jgi:hypothetical protein